MLFSVSKYPFLLFTNDFGDTLNFIIKKNEQDPECIICHVLF